MSQTPKQPAPETDAGARPKRTALVAGATGLVGRQLLALLLDDEAYETVYAVVRRPLPAHPRLRLMEVDFNHLGEIALPPACDVFCCLGTTLRAAGSRQAFRTVDHDYAVNLAVAARKAGARQFLLVSALGADPASAIFYNRVKGETEKKIVQVGFPTVHIFRPSLLLGARPEKRPGEDAAKWVNRWLGIIIPRRYRAIDSLKVARAMVCRAKEQTSGVCVHESDSLWDF